MTLVVPSGIYNFPGFSPYVSGRIPTLSMSTALQPVLPSVFKGTFREFVIPSVLLTPNDLRKLYRLLEQKAVEAADRQIAPLVRQPNQTEKQFEDRKQAVRGALALVVRIQTSSGDWLGGTTIAPLADEQLPDGITKIEFESNAIYRNQLNTNPDNFFLISIDLSRPSVLDMAPEPSQNQSVAKISAQDPTWANGLYNELETFFRQRTTKRGWLHSHQSYNVVLLLIGFPLSFDVVYHLDRLIRKKPSLPEALSIALYVYIVLIVLFFFRILFNYGRWAFPKVEVNAPRQHIGVAHRLAISTVTLMVLSVLIKALFKLFGIG